MWKQTYDPYGYYLNSRQVITIWDGSARPQLNRPRNFELAPSVLFFRQSTDIYTHTLLPPSLSLFTASFASSTLYNHAIMHLPPPEVLMSWPLPNYVNPVTRGSAVLIVNIVTITIAFLVTCLRLYTRFRITCTPGLDDILIVIALVCP